MRNLVNDLVGLVADVVLLTVVAVPVGWLLSIFAQAIERFLTNYGI